MRPTITILLVDEHAIVRQGCRLVAEGKACAQIAESLSLAPKSVSNYSLRIKQQLGASSLADLIRLAITEGIAKQ